MDEICGEWRDVAWLRVMYAFVLNAERWRTAVDVIPDANNKNNNKKDNIGNQVTLGRGNVNNNNTITITTTAGVARFSEKKKKQQMRSRVNYKIIKKKLIYWLRRKVIIMLRGLFWCCWYWVLPLKLKKTTTKNEQWGNDGKKEN